MRRRTRQERPPGRGAKCGQARNAPTRSGAAGLASAARTDLGTQFVSEGLFHWLHDSRWDWHTGFRAGKHRRSLDDTSKSGPIPAACGGHLRLENGARQSGTPRIAGGARCNCSRAAKSIRPGRASAGRSFEAGRPVRQVKMPAACPAVGLFCKRIDLLASSATWEHDRGAPSTGARPDLLTLCHSSRISRPGLVCPARPAKLS